MAYALTDFRRLARFVRSSGLVDLGLSTSVLGVANLAARHGLSLRTVHALHAKHSPSRVALVDDRTSLTYGDLNDRINQLCHALDELGVRRGARIVLCMENRVEYVLFWFAAFRAGVSVVHASYRSTVAELDYLLDHCNARAIVCSPKTAEVVAATSHECERIVLDDDGVALERLTGDRPIEFFARASRAAQDNVVYTSGTTGKPKGAVRDFNSMGIVELSRIGVALPVRTGQRHLVVGPLYHSAPQAFVAMMTSLGCTIYLRPRFDAEDALSAISRHQIHTTFMVPTMIRRLVDLPDVVHRQNPTPELCAIVSGAAAFPHALRERAIDRFGANNIYDFYGATELGWLTLIRGDEMLRKPGSVGRPLEGHQLRIATNGNALPSGDVGTIWARNPQTMEGYLNDEQATAASTDGGWITVDDLGSIDRDGYLFLAGRDRDMIISGGVNVYPVEIEERLGAHPEVIEVAVVGLPDDDLGERVTAVYVGSVSPDELETWARQALSGTKVPRRWEQLDELPRNPTGKILKRQLRERFGAVP